MGLIRNSLEPLRQLRHRAHAERLANDGGGRAAIVEWRATCRDKVVAGLFSGMRYPARWGDASAPAKWLGSYEEELWHPIKALLDRDLARVVVIGSADGYYSVGTALAVPGVRVDAFDPEWLARRNTTLLARENGVADRVVTHGLATIASLNAILGPAPQRTLVISDCEGAEDELIDPVGVPAFSTADLVVELHEEEDSSLGDRIAARFPSHTKAFVVSQHRDVSRYPSLATIDRVHHPFIVREFRMAQRWLALTAPRTPGSP
jgi:hypothetical protein